MTTIKAVLLVSIAYIALGEPHPQPSWQPVLYLDMTKKVFIGEKEELQTLSKMEGAIYKKDERPRATDLQDVVGILRNGIHSVQSDSVNTAVKGGSFSELNEGLPLVFTVNKTVHAFIGPYNPKQIVLKLNYDMWQRTNTSVTSAEKSS